eukprot:scaffold3993_cov146-Skeletonema_marinoi.AAC.6
MMCRPPRANTSRRRTGPTGGPSAATSPFKNLKWSYLEKYDSQHVGRTHAYSQEIVEWDAGVIDVVNMMVCIFDYYTIGHVVANNLSSLKNQFERDL